MKATEQYFTVVLFITLYKVVLTFESVVEILESLTIQLKVNEQYFPVVLLIMLYKVLLTFKSVDKIIKCDYSHENYLLCCTRLYLLMSASSQKMLSKNRPEEKKKENHILTYISHLAEVKRKNNYGVAISVEASSKRNMEGMTLCVYRTVLVE